MITAEPPIRGTEAERDRRVSPQSGGGWAGSCGGDRPNRDLCQELSASLSVGYDRQSNHQSSGVRGRDCFHAGGWVWDGSYLGF